MEVFQQRNKNKQKFTEGLFPDYDQQTIELISKKIGCKLPSWNSTSDSPLCSPAEEIQNGRTMLTLTMERKFNTLNYTVEEPCRGLEKFQLVAHDIDQETEENEPPTVRFKIMLDGISYKEVNNVRSMDRQTLIGKRFPPLQ